MICYFLNKSALVHYKNNNGGTRDEPASLRDQSFECEKYFTNIMGVNKYPSLIYIQDFTKFSFKDWI